LNSLRFAFIALACLVVGGLAGLVVAAAGKPSAPAPARFLPPPTAPPDFVLRDQNGHRMSPQDAHGSVLVMTFLYSTCRTLCPAQAQEIKNGVVKAGVKNVQVYGVSVDPVGDTQLNARRFLARAGLVDPRVHFLIGSRPQLAAVWRQYGIVPINASPQEAAAAAAAYDWQHGSAGSPGCPGTAAGEKQKGCADGRPPAAAEEPYPDTSDGRYRGLPRHGSWDFEHTAYVLVIDKHGRQRVGFPFEQLTAARLAEDIKTLSKQS